MFWRVVEITEHPKFTHDSLPIHFFYDLFIFYTKRAIHLKPNNWNYSNVWLGVRVCVQNTPTYNSLTATTHPRGFTFVSAFGTAALPTLDRSDPRDLPFDHTMTGFLIII